MNRSLCPEPFFLDTSRGPRFCIFHPAAASSPKCPILYVHPFAEEMNKARRMAALQARALAQAGHAVLQIDLLGCGDSAGDFGDATWDAWHADLSDSLHWLGSRVSGAPYLWGLRLGALLALDFYQQRQPGCAGFILWQPIVNGAAFVTQFLRLRVANAMLAGASGATDTNELRRALQSGEALEIAGYLLNPQLAAAIDALELQALAPTRLPVRWFEVVGEPSRPLPPASKRVLAAWREQGIDVLAQAVGGESFWATQEITECAALIAATIEAMQSLP